MDERNLSEQAEELIDGAMNVIRSKGVEHVIFSLDVQTTVGVIAQLQLAFRHPGNVGAMRETVEEMTRQLIERLDPAHGDLYQLLMMGFDPSADEEIYALLP